MTDVRQGPLLLKQDPFSLTADRVALARPMTPAELEAWYAVLDGPRTRPVITAPKGYDPRPFFDRAYYKSVTGWRDTLTEELWQGDARP